MTMKAIPGASVASSDRGNTRMPEGAQPPVYPSLQRADGAGSAVPNASYGGKDGTLQTIAQTRYNAPAGWTTPAGTKAEGIVWTTPSGKTVTGTAPSVFLRG
jgi:hypothetical protein